MGLNILFYVLTSLIGGIFATILNFAFELFVLPIFTFALYKNYYDLKVKNTNNYNFFSDLIFFFKNNYLSHLGFFYLFCLVNLLGMLCLIVGYFVTLGIFFPGFAMRAVNPQMTAGETMSRCWAAGKAHGNMWTAALGAFLWFVIIFAIDFLIMLWAVRIAWKSPGLYWTLIVFLMLWSTFCTGGLTSMGVTYLATVDPPRTATVTSAGNMPVGQTQMVQHVHM
eukprot:gnl/Carplike_NY0171/12609_a18247_112.p1 GENE.gnl/Carplike_NY0171/12609_a18247_112~~gnl/Carplike_NY0171/12609_a18247_112.p1  ORF type:complete len:224 (+),score=31.84 gnl/Carplike_NY0171/12609_a18247_112:176-847(+)